MEPMRVGWPCRSHQPRMEYIMLCFPRGELTQGQLVAAVHLPEMPCLSVEANHLVHGFDLGFLPFFRRHPGRFGKDEHAGFDLEFMGMPAGVSLAAVGWCLGGCILPKFLFLGMQGLVDVFGDHVFDPDQSCIFLVGVVDETLPEVFADMRAVMICFDKASDSAAGLVCVDV